jgi:anti-anti-sigma regulatory factor
VAVATGPVVHVVGPLDQLTVGQLHGCLRRGRRPRAGDVVLVRLDRCDFVDARGFRGLVRLKDEVLLAGGRLLVVDPPRSLQIACEVYPGRLDLVPAPVAEGSR